ncbi:MAG TPA: SRPBCC family protein [Oceanobacillus sp.]|nr:SRPBCC family protein [Oceanobacillus sp.]
MVVQPTTELRRGIHHEQPLSYPNMSRKGRYLAVLVGGILVGVGLVRGGVRGLIMMLVGGGVIAQGVTGISLVLKAIGANRAVRTNEKAVAVPHQQGFRVEKSITIDSPIEEIYSYWRNFENLPNFMSHLEAVEVQDDDIHSHWVAKAPAGMNIEWDAEIINEIPNEVIGWRSVEGAAVPNAGAVRFRPAPGGRGTEIQVKIEYLPPAGPIGAAVAAMFGEDPNTQVAHSLRQFKQLIEAGEVATNDGQPHGPYRP